MGGPHQEQLFDSDRLLDEARAGLSVASRPPKAELNSGIEEFLGINLACTTSAAEFFGEREPRKICFGDLAEPDDRSVRAPGPFAMAVFTALRSEGEGQVGRDFKGETVRRRPVKGSVSHRDLERGP